VRVLLIEDYGPAVRALKLGLQEEGYEVDVARSADDGLARAWKGPYDVILLDLMLPQGRSFTLLKSWRQAGLMTHVLALAPPGGTEDTVRGLDMGADDCLTKPFEFDELLARMRALLRRRATVEDAVVRIGDLEINTAVRTVRRAGRPIHLTPREFGLLEFLANHRGKVVSRSMIWDQLYDDKLAAGSNVVDVYIGYLRGKIDKGFDPPLILTRWGEGYVLRGEDG
jgi:DNA-binding response OmpR family regulator